MNRLLYSIAGCLIGTALAASVAHAADPIRIGMVAPSTGGAAETGRYQINGAKLAAKEINDAGGVMGRPLELVIEDDQTTNPGAVLAFNKLASDSSVVAFLGPIRSTQVYAIEPSVRKVGKPMAFGGTDPKLTHLGDPWMFRFRPNDKISTAAMAGFGVNDLGKKKWAIVYSTDAFGTSAKDLLVPALKDLGVEPATLQGFTSNSQDLTPVVLEIKQSGADVIASFATVQTDQAILAKQLRQFGVAAPVIGSASLISATAMKLAGPDLYGSYALTDFFGEETDAAKAFSASYEKAYGNQPDFFASWSYDAVHVLAKAIGDAKSTEPDAIRQALLAVKGYEGAEGTYDFDENGDGLHAYSVVQNKDGKVVFVKRVEAAEIKAKD
ncbi:MAG: ABC transporter substrate-binding protein [Mesorhizobium sp.]|nr:ABC transporter substrate-binding protein [Mesorhizobium sp.]MBN9245241.1 ABC transporter substrate-binding protein [Mesorhizobium sp.]